MSSTPLCVIGVCVCVCVSIIHVLFKLRTCDNNSDKQQTYVTLQLTMTHCMQTHNDLVDFVGWTTAIHTYIDIKTRTTNRL
jgi:hypothetical protein